MRRLSMSIGMQASELVEFGGEGVLEEVETKETCRLECKVVAVVSIICSSVPAWLNSLMEFERTFW